MATNWSQRWRRPAVCLLGCLLVQCLISPLSKHSWVFAGPSLQSRLTIHRRSLLVQAEGPAAGPSLDDLFSEPQDAIPSGLKDKAEATAGALQQVDPRQPLDAIKSKSAGLGVNNFDLNQVVPSVSAYTDSVGSAALASLKKLFPKLEPQLSTLEPKQLVLAVFVAAIAFLTVLFTADSSKTDDSTINPKAAGSTANISSSTPKESRGTPGVSSQEPAPQASATSVLAPPFVSVPDQAEAPAPPEAKTDLIELTDRNAVKGAGFIAFLVGYAQGGIWLGGALFIVASWVGMKRTDDFATIVKGFGRNGIKVVNFGSYLEGKYKLTEQLGSGLANASASVKEENKQASAVIDPAANVVGAILEREAAIKDSVDSFTTAATDTACLAGDAAVQVLDKTVDTLGFKVPTGLQKDKVEAA